jgi:hypothetical protein
MRLAPWQGDALAAGYLASAILLNVTIGRELLPMWPDGRVSPAPWATIALLRGS